MIIAIDYDNTYTADPHLWDEFIRSAEATGHTVICVTARPDTMGQPVLDSIGKLVPVIFCGGEWKREVALSRGYKVNVWIDDSPEYIAPQLLIGRR
jgi:hydroxymethylpyrimidine pyrophosphatase-like HAD family hydrolase